MTNDSAREWRDGFYGPVRDSVGVIVTTANADYLNALERDNRKLREALRIYGSHLGNCNINAWNDDLTTCSCGLFPLLAAAALEEGQT